MRLLFLNWRCIANPAGGGAELLVHRLALNLARRGHEVTMFTSSFPGAAGHEVIDGVNIVRRGSRSTVHWRAYAWYQRNRARIDLVVESVNTIPFFAHMYASCPTVTLIHQLAREVWFRESALPLAPIGYVAEPVYMRAYANRPVITVSDSTATSLKSLGLRSRIDVLPIAVATRMPDAPKTCSEEWDVLRLMSLARLTPSKRIEHSIMAANILRDQGVPARLDIVGHGGIAYVRRLQRLVERLELQGHVTFHGYVSEEKKQRLLRQSHVLLATSVREGWCLAVTEAHAAGIPTVAYDVPGLRESTRHLMTGYVCGTQSPEELAAGVMALWQRPGLRRRLQRRAWEETLDLSWDRTTDVFWRCALSHIERHKASERQSRPRRKAPGGARNSDLLIIQPSTSERPG